MDCSADATLGRVDRRVPAGLHPFLCRKWRAGAIWPVNDMPLCRVGPFALAEKCGISPLSPGLSRNLGTKNLSVFFSSAAYSRNRVLCPWVGRTSFPLAEAYSVRASHWAARGLSPLLLPPHSDFWTAQERSIPAETGDFSRPLPQIGMGWYAARRARSSYSTRPRVSAWETRLSALTNGVNWAFGTGIGFEVRAKDGDYPLDASLTAEAQDGALHGRQTTSPGEIESRHISFIYALGERFSQFHVRVESHLWWREGWQLHVHHYRAHQPSRLILGAYSLAAYQQERLQPQGNFPFVRAENASIPSRCKLCTVSLR